MSEENAIRVIESRKLRPSQFPQNAGRDQGELPLVRFTGYIGETIRWSADEKRAAFLVRRPHEAGYAQRLLCFRVGDRHAAPVSMPGQAPSHFVWLRRSLLKLAKDSADEILAAIAATVS